MVDRSRFYFVIYRDNLYMVTHGSDLKDFRFLLFLDFLWWLLLVPSGLLVGRSRFSALEVFFSLASKTLSWVFIPLACLHCL